MSSYHISRSAGIDFCLYHCPAILQPICIGQLDTPCRYLVNELKKRKRGKEKREIDIDLTICKEIQKIVKQQPLLTREIIDRWGMKQQRVFTLIRWGVFEITKKKKKGGNKDNIRVVGVNLDNLR